MLPLTVMYSSAATKMRAQPSCDSLRDWEAEFVLSVPARWKRHVRSNLLLLSLFVSIFSTRFTRPGFALPACQENRGGVGRTQLNLSVCLIPKFMSNFL